LAQQRYRQIENPEGGLFVWEEPRKGAKYTIGIDCAGGGAAGDSATAVAVENESCDVVAVYRGKVDAVPWGEKCVLFGHMYEEALLAFETKPSMFGLAACRRAVEQGYVNIYRQQRLQIASLDPSANLGWHTDQATKPALIERIKVALRARSKIPSEELRLELGQRQWIGDSKKIQADKFSFGGDGHDDLVIAYGIALCVRDMTWIRPPDYMPAPVPTGETERYWARRHAEIDRRTAGTRQRRWRLYAGI
jgi:hypothetical protein